MDIADTFLLFKTNVRALEIATEKHKESQKKQVPKVNLKFFEINGIHVEKYI